MKKILTTIIIVVAVLLGYWFYIKGGQYSTNSTVSPSPIVSTRPSISATPRSSTSPNPSSSPTVKTTFTLTEVAQHNSASSCYSAVNGLVYDLTAWVNQHPGGQSQILSICGKDGSSAFNTQHDSKKKPADILITYKIGTLVQ